MTKYKQKSNSELAAWKADHKETSKEYHLADMEIKRRLMQPTATRSWIAIGISFVALIVSAIAVFIK